MASAYSPRFQLDLAFSFVKGISKLPLECTSAPGFVVNRVLSPYMAEAMFLARSHVPLKAIDKAAEDFGMPMGPIELVDSVGLDVVLHVSKILGAAFDRQVPDEIAAMVESGKLGRKSGQGFYTWRDGKVVSKDQPGHREGPPPADIVDRLMLPLVNEAVACLHEGVVSDADLLDAGVIFGTGFAPFRGGPLQYARDRGVDTVITQLRRFQDQLGERYRPHDGWREFT